MSTKKNRQKEFRGQRKNTFVLTFGKYCCSKKLDARINSCPFLGPTEEEHVLGCGLLHAKLENSTEDEENRPVRCPRCISVYK